MSVENKPGRPWQKGQSGYPKGRAPTNMAIAEIARNEIERRRLVEKLGAIAAGKTSQAVRACELLMNYAYGKPQQPVTRPDGDPLAEEGVGTMRVFVRYEDKPIPEES